MRIVVASGKGGTGKTAVATSLAWVLGERGVRVAYADTDVEEPNGHLFLWPSELRSERLAVPMPALRGDACRGCGLCQEACRFHAILALPDRVETFPELCHSCGACIRACPEEALIEAPTEIGTVRSGRAGKVFLVDGVLDVGRPRAVPLIEAVLRRLAAAREVPVLGRIPFDAEVPRALARGETPLGIPRVGRAIRACWEALQPLLGTGEATVAGTGGVPADAPRR